MENVMTEGNTETDLQALFDSVLVPDAKRPHQVPWSMRKLPDSFFTPPTTGSKSIGHSRENSTDSAASNSLGIFTTPSLNTVPLQTVHQRAHSSPASLQQYSFDEKSSTYQHPKQLSCDLAKASGKTNLPFGWEAALTPEGQVYYLNHITRTTTWEDPRKFQGTTSPNQSSTIQSRTNTTSLGSDLLGPLPEGWEQSLTPEGDIYFINHLTRITSWYDPRIPIHLQQVSSGDLIASPWYNDLLSSSCQIERQDLRLQLLHIEREKLRQRQEEIKKQQSLGTSEHKMSLPQFVSEYNEHSRQQSLDSALGESLKECSESASSTAVIATENFLCTINSINLNENQDVQMPAILNMEYNMDSSDVLIPSLQIQKEFS
ncbi:hypothetical protein WA026_009351 [Henosepilachna vigintioctopunctata]|uniref:WW domain-containing protein n=1 Tax=Henosepilachna vigintioctopunctata TaxID=420089 RepID=A0AAW1TZ35_9CUCU